MLQHMPQLCSVAPPTSETVTLPVAVRAIIFVISPIERVAAPSVVVNVFCSLYAVVTFVVAYART